MKDRIKGFFERMNEPIITGWRLVGWSVAILLGSIIMNAILFFAKKVG